MPEATSALFFTPNPCIERTLRVADFARGASHRVSAADVRVTAGGKGINAARVARNFGARAQVLAPVGRNQSAHFGQLLQQDGLQCDLVEVAPDTRTATNIVHAGGWSELVEAGTAPARTQGDELMRRFALHLNDCALAVIGGSYPPSAPDDQNYWDDHAATLCELAARAGVRVLYDGKGGAFARAIQSAHPPWAIKPNLDEASELLGRELKTAEAQRGAVAELRERGIAVVLLSCGADGLWLGWGSHVERLQARAVTEISPVGSGDALVGAFAATWLQSGDVIEATRLGMAAGSANAAQFEAARIGPHDVQALLAQTPHDRAASSGAT